VTNTVPAAVSTRSGWNKAAAWRARSTADGFENSGTYGHRSYFRDRPGKHLVVSSRFSPTARSRWRGASTIMQGDRSLVQRRRSAATTLPWAPRPFDHGRDNFAEPCSQGLVRPSALCPSLGDLPSAARCGASSPFRAMPRANRRPRASNRLLCSGLDNMRPGAACISATSVLPCRRR